MAGRRVTAARQGAGEVLEDMILQGDAREVLRWLERADEHAFCARECPNFHGKPTPLRIRHNRARTRFWWGADCCPAEAQPPHSAHINEDMKRLVWALNHWPVVQHTAADLGIAQAKFTGAQT